MRALTLENFFSPFSPYILFYFLFSSLSTYHTYIHTINIPLPNRHPQTSTCTRKIYIKRVRHSVRKAFFGLEKKVWIVERLTKTLVL